MLFQIIIVLIALLFLPATYIYFNHIRWQSLPRRMAYWVWIPNVFLLLYSLSLILFMPINASHSVLLGRALLPVYLLAIGQATYVLISVIGKVISRKPPIRRGVNQLGLVLAVCAIGTMLYGHLWGSSRITVVPYTYHAQRLPQSFDNYRIVQLSDLHLASFYAHPDVVRRLVDSVNAQHPDLIVITGDLVSFSAIELQHFAGTLRHLKAPDGVIAIMGNHDYATYTPALDSVGRQADIAQLHRTIAQLQWQILLNSHTTRQRGTDTIAIAGTENTSVHPKLEYADIARTTQGIPPSQFQLMLTHDPLYWRSHVLPQSTADLTLAGHLHGFQYLLFGLSPSMLFSAEWSGPYSTAQGRTLYVSRGIGTSAIFPVRFGAWPEINVITLQKTL